MESNLLSVDELVPNKLYYISKRKRSNKSKRKRSKF